MQLSKSENDDFVRVPEHPIADLLKGVQHSAEAVISQADVGEAAVPSFETIAPGDVVLVEDDVEVEVADAEVELLGDPEVVVLEGALGDPLSQLAHAGAGVVRSGERELVKPK